MTDIEVVRDQGEIESVQWEQAGSERVTLTRDGCFVTTARGDRILLDDPFVTANDVITAYRILHEGLEPPEGFEVKRKQGQIQELDANGRWQVFRMSEANHEGCWHLPYCLTTSEFIAIADILRGEADEA